MARLEGQEDGPILFCTMLCLLIEASGGRSLSGVEQRCYRRYSCISEEESFEIYQSQVEKFEGSCRVFCCLGPSATWNAQTASLLPIQSTGT